MSKQSTLESFLELAPSKRVILMKHYSGVPPSAIDKQLGLLRFEARRAIVEYWAYDKAMAKRPIL